ncbi:MAG: secondary thiamine-phosphate synthase enzyme YjbQ [Deltaproteobacteria bacterium]|jgi:secondary thiamine-phosphate synthase enzyme|nr:secondary thiamine-phosphate synthase enzyme YjbQ [Deltaproteobacteria bacterium]
MVFEHVLDTGPSMMYSITEQVLEDIKAFGVTDGLAVVYCPHTTAAITINEGADPSVVSDLLKGLEAISPQRASYTHGEGNSHAHLKSTLVGVSQTLVIENGRLLLGTWQSVFFCEFDGPRRRKYYVKIINGSPIVSHMAAGQK